MKRIGLIGAGNMATAIIGGIVKSGMEVTLSAYDLDTQKIAVLQERYGVCSADSQETLLNQVDYLFLSIKPQNFPEVLAAAKGKIPPETVIISIAAGITADYLSQTLGYEAKVVQVMPNTPMLLGYGATALSKSALVSEEEFAFVRSIFDCAGMTAVVPSDRMNEVIPINGSAPAFIYQFAQYFITYGRSKGLEETVCRDLFAQALIGSAKMMTDSGYSIEELIQMVSSKGGTTIAGLEGLRENCLDKAVQEACEKCVARAYELTK